MYTHLSGIPVFLDSVNIRMMASSNRTVFPLPVGAAGREDPMTLMLNEGIYH